MTQLKNTAATDCRKFLLAQKRIDEIGRFGDVVSLAAGQAEATQLV